MFIIKILIIFFCLILLGGGKDLGIAQDLKVESEKASDISGFTKLAQLTWSTIETEHFFIHYHQGLEELARLSAGYAEEAHMLLSPILDWEPEEKVHMIVSDTLDQQNGSAAILPYPTLRIFPNAPEISGVIAEYENQDWLRALILHEYVHILHLDTVEGYSRLIRTIFGRPGYAPNPLVNGAFLYLNSPNYFAPLWFWEGLAVYFETEFTHSGRGRSSRSEMVLRMAALENQLLQLDQIDFHQPGIPGENVRYLYGGYFINFMVAENTKRAVRDLNHNIAGWLPYLGIETVQNEFEEQLPGIYRRFLADQMQEQQKRIKTLRSQPLTSFHSLYSGGYEQKNFALSPDESKIAFVESSGHTGKRIRVWSKDQGHFEDIMEQNAFALIWHPSENYLFYTAAVPKEITTYRDLFVYDFQNQESYQLTENARVGDIDISPEGKSLVAVETNKGHQNLVVYQLSFSENEKKPPFIAKRIKKLTNYQYSRVSTPRWDHQGRRVVYSLTNRKGVTVLPIMEVATQTIIDEIDQGHLQSSPIWGEMDQNILFSSDHSGVSNIYQFDLKSRKLNPITHVLGGAFLPMLAPQSKRLYFQNYVNERLELAYMNWDVNAIRSEPLPAIQSTWYFNDDLAKQRDQSSVPIITEQPKAYDFREYLTSQFWFIYGNEEPDRYAWGIITSGEDPLLEHSYFATVTQGKQKTYHQISFTSDTDWTSITLNTTRLPRRYPRGLGVPHLWETVHDASLTLSFKLGAWDMGGGLLYRYQEPFNDGNFVDEVNQELAAEIEENSGSPAIDPLFENTRDYFNTRTFIGRRQGVQGFVSYSNFKHYPLSISEEKGFSLALNFIRFPAHWGNDPAIKVIDGKAFDRTLSLIKADNPEAEGLTTAQKETFIQELRGEEKQLSNDHTLLIGNYTTYLSTPWQHHVVKLEFNRGISLNQNESQAMFTTGYDIPLRGYRKHVETGQQFTTGSIEWRMPLFQIFRGEEMLPFYYRQLHASFFYDHAAFSGDFQSTNVVVGEEIFYLRDTLKQQTRRSAGMELKLLTHLGYRYPTNLILRFSNAMDINQIFGVKDEKPFWIELDYGLTF